MRLITTRRRSGQNRIHGPPLPHSSLSWHLLFLLCRQLFIRRTRVSPGTPAHAARAPRAAARYAPSCASRHARTHRFTTCFCQLPPASSIPLPALHKTHLCWEASASRDSAFPVLPTHTHMRRPSHGLGWVLNSLSISHSQCEQTSFSPSRYTLVIRRGRCARLGRENRRRMRQAGQFWRRHSGGGGAVEKRGEEEHSSVTSHLLPPS